MGQVSYNDLRKRIRKRIWPGGEPRNLAEAHNDFFVQAMIELGKWVECLRLNNTSVYPACSTYVECAKTIVEEPIGSIRRVYTIANDDWCDRVYFWRSDFSAMERQARNLIRTWTPPQNKGLTALQQGIKFAEASTDLRPGTDSPYGRARTGVWALYRHRFYLFPWIQSNESLVIEWDGYKKDWQDADVLDEELWTPDVEDAIASFVKWKHELNYGAPERAVTFKREFYGDPLTPGGQLGDLMYWCKRQMEQRDAIEPSADPRSPTFAEVTDDAIPEETPDSQFAIIGDFGDPDNGTKEQEVADMVKGWDDGEEKFFIVTLGDNIYAPAVSYEESITPFYGDYVTDDLTTNRFWPAIGNHDRNDPTGGIQAYYDYFSLPNNERYYDFVKGTVHFFILHSALSALGGTVHEPDGLTQTSIQAMWLKAKLALSTAKWKVVIVQDPPYTLGTDYPGHTILRWPFKDWGADVLVAGDTHAYERYEVDGFPYVVAGTGGTELAGSLNADAGNLLTAYKKFTALQYGALKGEADCETLKLEFMALPGTVVDTLTLTKE